MSDGTPGNAGSWGPAGPPPPPPQPSLPPQPHPAQAWVPQPPPAHGQQWAPPPPPRRRSAARWWVAGGALVVVGALGATLALTLTGGDGADAHAAPRVEDIPTEAEVVWEVDLAHGADLVLPARPVAVGPDHALAWSTFDDDAWTAGNRGSVGWYDDYDTHYDLGYAAGTAYAEAYEKAEEAYAEDGEADVDWPIEEEYWPDELPGEWWDFDPDVAGYYDGFDDGQYGEDEGANRLEAPEPVDFAPSVTLVDLRTGDELWTLDLTQVDPDLDHTWSVLAVSLDGEDTVAVTVREPWNLSDPGLDQVATIATVDTTDGSVLDSTTIPATTVASSVEGALLTVTEEEGRGEGSTLRRLDPAALDADPVWEIDVEGRGSVSPFAPGQGVVVGTESALVFSLADGAVLWEGDEQPAVTGSTLLEADGYASGDTYEVRGVSASGEDLWEADLEVANLWTPDGYLFTAADMTAGYAFADVQRIDPRTGEEMWETPVDELDFVAGVARDGVVAASGKKLLVLDPRTGEVVVSHTVRGWYAMETTWLGTDAVYVATEDDLVAYSLSEDERLWTMPVPDGTQVLRIGNHLVLADHETGALSGLGAS